MPLTPAAECLCGSLLTSPMLENWLGSMRLVVPFSDGLFDTVMARYNDVLWWSRLNARDADPPGSTQVLIPKHTIIATSCRKLS